MSERIAITGIGAVTHSAYGVDEVWNRLMGRLANLKADAPFDMDGMRSVQNTIVDPNWSRHFLSRRFPVTEFALPKDTSAGTVHGAGAAAEALAMAGLDTAGAAGFIGLVLGTTSGGNFDAFVDGDTHNIEASVQHASLTTLATIFGISGPIAQISNACTSSAAAIIHAVGMLRQGRVERVLVGGADHARRADFAGFNALRAMSSTKCRAFDKDRDGMIIGDGAAMLVIETEASAKRRCAKVLAWIDGFGLSSDGEHPTRPSPDGLSRAISYALHSDAVERNQISYVNCHGTGTPHNDVTEAKALSEHFASDARPLLSSTKTTTGHLLGTAAALEAVITVMVLRQRQTPPMSHTETLDPAIEFPVALDNPHPVEGDYALSTTLGFGGANACLMFRRNVPETNHAT